MKLKMIVDNCCGGGHCGPVPGYEFTCPACNRESACRTGFALRVGQTFSCVRCKSVMTVRALAVDSEFEVDLQVANP